MAEKEERPPPSLEDALYTAVGLAVLGFQQLQLLRRDLQNQLRSVMEPKSEQDPTQS